MTIMFSHKFCTDFWLLKFSLALAAKQVPWNFLRFPFENCPPQCSFPGDLSKVQPLASCVSSVAFFSVSSRGRHLENGFQGLLIALDEKKSALTVS